MTRRVLIVVYYWPPLAGSGVQRWLKFSKHFVDQNVQPVIVTPANPYYPLRDESLLKDIPEEVEVMRYPIVEPYKWAERLTGKPVDNTGKVKYGEQEKLSWKQRLMSYVRGRFFIPDPRVLWVRPTVKKLGKYLDDHPVDAVITSGPPHSLHLIGLRLKKHFPDLKWIADFRDPMSQLDFMKAFGVEGDLLKKYQSIEQEILAAADVITGTSPSMHQLLQPFDKEKYRCVTNGFDADDFVIVNAIAAEKPIIFHAGLMNELRNPVHLWQALDELAAAGEEFELHLAGSTDASILAYIQNKKYLAVRLKNLGYISHEEVVERYVGAHINLLLINNSENAQVNIPGKLFEQLAARRPILAFGTKGCDAFKIIKRLDAGPTLDYDADINYIKACVKDVLEARSFYFEGDIQQYSRKSLAKKYLNIIYKDRIWKR